jgi:GT2 family glycosyltransferase/glycosyltransferase involved in cell wall biosynthesis
VDPIKLAFVSCQDHLATPFLAKVSELFPELPLYTVSEFPPAHGKWIPYKPNRTHAENRDRIQAAIAGHPIRLSAAVLEPNTPYWPMRRLALELSPLQFIAFNENLDHFMLRPRCLPTIARHALWRTRNFVRTQIRPGGFAYTWAWRFRHPKALKRPFLYRLALVAGDCGALLRRLRPPKQDPPLETLPPGVSIVIPTRNGKDLVLRLLDSLLPQLPEPAAEILIVDNGSDDGTAETLAERFPQVRVLHSPEPLSFSAAVNRGIRSAAYSYVCLLNNDMILEPGFFPPLLDAFRTQPHLFCATAQILFPEGMRRQETGKAVWYAKEEGRGAKDFPVRCLEPISGEDRTWVLYGSGGCSLFDTAKLRAIGCFDERIAPAYVEDLDTGWRGWQRGWPTVYVAEARLTHFHRSTTSRYFSPELLQSFVEYNFLRFLTRHVHTPAVFQPLWRDAIGRLNLLAIEQPWFVGWAQEALAFAPKAVRLLQPAPDPLTSESHILAIGSGATATFPGRPPTTGRPHVLIASPYLPFPLSHGAAVRIYNLMRCAAADVDQILIAFVDDLGPVPKELTAIAAEVILVKRYPSHLLPDNGRPDVVEEYDSPHFHAAVKEAVRKWNPAVAQLEFTQMAIYAKDCASAPTILVEHDITFDLQQQLLTNSKDWETERQYNRWVQFEKQAWRDVDSVVVMSEKDRQAVADPKAATLPNGVDLARFQSAPTSQPDPRRILFIGSFAHLPNILAIDFFLRECWPYLESLQPVLHVIAGSRHRYFLDRYQDQAQPPLDQPRIEIEDFVSDVRPAYERATVVIAPLIASAGTNIKVMEAMAMRKAVVSTPAGINGLDLTNGHDVLVVNSGKEMADAIATLFADPPKRLQIEQHARETVEQHFDWQAIARKQSALYYSLTKPVN